MIFWSIWSWAKRHHTTKSKGWIKRKYFTSIGNRNWIFFGSDKEKTITLFSAQSIKMVRHLKIRNNANPFDENWKHYFIARKRNGTDMLCRAM
jgi:RNA-directed DNA polymerase